MVDDVTQPFEDFDGILHDDHWSESTLTFGFPTASADYEAGYRNGTPTNNFEALNATQTAAVRGILGQITDFTNLAFSENTVTPGDATLRFGMSDDPSAAFAYLPSTTYLGGDSWYNNSKGNYDDPVLGGFAHNEGFMHEIGHALGLEHGHEVGTFGALPYALDSNEFSVMTYRDHVGDTGNDGSENETWGNAQTYMMLDIAALQYMYGADYDAGNRLWGGDTTYTFDPVTGETFIDGVSQGLPGDDSTAASNRIFRTIWDGHGEDTYDLSAYAQAMEIDLRPGAWSTFSEAQLADLDGDFDRTTNMARGNVANARLHDGDTRSLIENAIGGSAADTITGNQGANRLDGGAGDDTLAGGAGDDTLRGQAGDDRLHYSAGLDVLDGGAGTDSVDFSQMTTALWLDLGYDGFYEAYTRGGSDLASGDWRALAVVQNVENATGTAYDDHLRGDAGDNRLLGGSDGTDVLRGLGGADTLGHSGGTGITVLDGGSGTDTALFDTTAVWVYLDYYGTYDAYTRDGSDLSSGAWRAMARLESIENLTGSSGDDELGGDAGQNRLNGGEGTDRLYGQGGDDTLVYGSASAQTRDRLDGGSGVDTADFSGFDAAVWVDLGSASTFDSYTRDGTDLSSGTWQAIASLTAIENVVGTSYADELIGDGGANVLDGGGGAGAGAGQDDDTLIGRGGNDGFVYRSGLDRFEGGSGTDTADFTAFGSAVWVDLGYSGAYEAYTRDNADLTSGSWRTIADLQSIEDVSGSAYADKLVGDAGNNLLYGAAGDDRLGYTGGLDVLDGGTGDDTADFSSFGSAVWVDLGYAGTTEAFTRDDVDLDSGSWRAIADLRSVEDITGTVHADELRGDGGDNRLFGGAGTDILDGAAGNDVLVGGSGGDTFVFDPGFDSATVRGWQDDTDLLDLRGFGFSDFDTLESLASDGGDNLLIDFTTGDSLTLIGLTTADFTKSDTLL